MNIEQLCFYSGILFSILYLISAILGFIGLDHDFSVDVNHDIETDDSSGDIQFLTIKNVIAFMVGLSWGTLAAYRDFHYSQWSSIGIGALSGIVLILLHVTFMFIMKKFEQKQIPSLNGAIGKIGTAYLPIPDFQDMGIGGKLTVEVDGTLKTLDAISSNGIIQTGKRAKVISVDGNILIVEQEKHN